MPNGQNKPVQNIVTRRYKDGSIIYFEGDRSDYVYILKTGRVILSFVKIETGEEMKEIIKVGEFFGVKSAIGKYPREETAQTIGDTTVLAVSRSDFEKMILKNVTLVTKMLRVFSNQLRRLGKAQREILGHSDTINPADELFKIGEYYYKMAKSQQALYAYKRYLEYYPGTKYSQQVMQRIRAIETGEVGPDITLDETPPTAETKTASITDDMGSSGDFDMTDFSLDEEESRAPAPAAKKGAGGSSGDDFFSEPAARSGGLSDDFSMDDDKGLDDFSFDEPDQAETKKLKDISEIFYEAVSQFSQENYNGALQLYINIMNTKNLRNDAERKIFEKTHFEVGRCYLKLGKVNDSVNAFTVMIKKFPKSDLIKSALYHMGLAYEMVKNIDKASAYYKKVSTMEPKDEIGRLALKKLNSLKK
ncbi:MAG: cyclic nucleotide-binding domain-containing protein [Spirochaetes bacterium]|jgi:CRP-like cAMP-binding protein|nr:cyclic nucleotide-binding domain-containing protein [Spirochaetota bacterium]